MLTVCQSRSSCVRLSQTIGAFSALQHVTLSPYMSITSCPLVTTIPEFPALISASGILFVRDALLVFSLTKFCSTDVHERFEVPANVSEADECWSWRSCNQCLLLLLFSCNPSANCWQNNLVLTAFGGFGNLANSGGPVYIGVSDLAFVRLSTSRSQVNGALLSIPTFPVRFVLCGPGNAEPRVFSAQSLTYSFQVDIPNNPQLRNVTGFAVLNVG